MIRLILAIAVVWGLVLVNEPALASCTMTTVYLPDGSVRFVQTCCYNGHCTQTWM
jgi:hypothetical protein